MAMKMVCGASNFDSHTLNFYPNKGLRVKVVFGVNHCKSSEKMIEHLIVDSGGFVRNCPIHEMAKNAYTVPGVVSEIRDKATRQRLKVLPYELKFRDPSPASLAAVSAAAKESGDFASLSPVDLQVTFISFYFL